MTEQDIIDLIGDYFTGHCDSCHNDPRMELPVIDYKGEEIEVCCAVRSDYRKWKDEVWAKKK